MKIPRMSQHCYVAFDDFNLQTKETIGSLFKSDNFADVTIVCNDGDQVPAHKFVLSSSSSLLHQMLLNSSSRFQNRNDFIYLPTVKIKELKPLLQFMYLGQTKIIQENLETFFRLAADLKINLGSPKSPIIAQQKEDKENESLEQYDGVFLETTPRSNNQESQNMDCLNTASEKEEESLVHPEFYDDNETEPSSNMENNSYNSDNYSHEPLDEYDSNRVAPQEENNLEEDKADEPDTEVIGEPNLEETFLSIKCEDKIVEKKTVKKLKGRKFNYPADVDSNSKVCPICKKVYNSIQGMQRHYQATHEKIRYNCDFCDYKGTQPNSLTLHIKQIHTNEVHTCNECNFEAKSKQKLKEHTKKYHMAIANFPCTLCDFKGISAGELKKHIEESHDGTKFPCDKCSYKASTPGHLAYHSKLHCPYCDILLLSKKEAHMKIHEQENYRAL